MLVELFNKVVMPQMRIWFGVQKGLTQDGRAKHWNESMDNVEAFKRELSSRGTDFFAGDQPGWLDYMIWPWFERIDSYSVIFKVSQNKTEERGRKPINQLQDELGFPRQRFPDLTKWMRVMLEDPAVSDYYLDTQTHAHFIQTLAVGGVPDYNILYRAEK